MRVNGTERQLPEPMTLEAFLLAENYRKDRVAVERNGSIVPRAAYPDTWLEQEDVLEIVSFVGGG